MNTKEINEWIAGVLAPSGFRYRRDTWYKANEDTITLVNLQKSQWGGQYYINLGIYLRDLGSATSPAEQHAHVRARLSAVAGNEAMDIDAALDLERTDLSDDQRKMVLGRALAGIAIPFLAARSVLPALRELHASGQLGPVLITKATRELLEAGPA